MPHVNEVLDGRPQDARNAENALITAPERHGARPILSIACATALAFALTALLPQAALAGHAITSST